MRHEEDDSTCVPAAAGGARADRPLTVNNGAETPIGAVLNLGKVAAGDTVSVRIRVRNVGAKTANITYFFADGVGFSIDRPTLPFPVAPGSVQDALLSFSQSSVAPLYPANLRVDSDINNVSAIVIAAVVVGPVLTVFPACTGSNGSPPSIDFGLVQAGHLRLCNFSLQNPGAAGYDDLDLPDHRGCLSDIPGTLSAVHDPGRRHGHVRDQFHAERGGLIYRFAGHRDPHLRAERYGFQRAASDAPARIRLRTDPERPTTAIDHAPSQRGFVLGVGIGQSGVRAGHHAGNRRPRGGVFGHGNALAAVFRHAGQHADFDRRANVGDVPNGHHFGTDPLHSFGSPDRGDATTVLTIPATAISLDSAIATRRTGDLDIQLTGFDNTYSAGAMTFTFFNISGQALPPGAIRADFTQDFRTFFTKAQAGSAFQVRVSFPVTGDTSGIGSVDVQLTNSAGVKTQHLIFQ